MFVIKISLHQDADLIKAVHAPKSVTCFTFVTQPVNQQLHD